MGAFLLKTCPLIFLLAYTNAAGVGKAWRVLPYSKLDYWNHPTWPRLDSSAFEVRTVSGVGRLVTFDDAENVQKKERLDTSNSDGAMIFPNSKEHPMNDEKSDGSLLDHFMRSVVRDPPHNLKNEHDAEEGTPSLESDGRDIIKDSFYNQKKKNSNDVEGFGTFQKVFRTGVMMKVVQPNNGETTLSEISNSPIKVSARVRRETQNETKMEQIATTKNVRDVRLSSPETWSAQPISVEFRHRASLDQMIQSDDEEDQSTKLRGYHAPHTDFVTSHHRRSYPENRESREMPATRTYDDYDLPWYRNMIRERDYDAPSYRRGYSYHYPDRYRTERDYYMRVPNEPSYYYDRYREDDFDLYGRSRPTPKPKRIIYYATLPEIVRKPVDLRNYPRPYDGLMRTPASRDGTYKRIPGNVDPSRYRYRQLYDGYDSYSKRSSYFDRPYAYPETDDRRKGSVKENLRNDGFEPNSERKLSNQISVRDDGKLPWPVQIGTEVSVKDDERIPGRKVFGESSGFERFHSAQLQKAPDATGSSELQSDN